MPVIICDKHGRQGCFHVSQGVLSAMEINDAHEIVRVIFLAKDGDEIFDYWFEPYMKKEEIGCPPFIGVFDEEKRTMTFDDDEHISKALCMFIPVCSACFREFIGNSSRSPDAVRIGL